MLHFDFSLPPTAAIASLQAKKPEVLKDEARLKHNIYNRVFTIKGIADVDLLSDIQKSLSENLLKGEDFKIWKSQAQSLLASANTALSPKRLEQIYTQNILSAYNQGRKEAQFALKGEIYLRYVSANDSRVRASHRILHGIVLPREHPFWEKHYPGQDFGCRCRAEAYTKGQLERAGLKVSMSEEALAAFRANPPKPQNEDNLKDLRDIIAAKLNAHRGNPHAQVRLRGILRELEQRNERFKRINGLFTQAAQKQNKSVDSKIVSIAKTTPKLKNELGTNADEILLSGWTLRTHTHHSNVDSFDYSLVEDMLGSEYRVKHSKEGHIVYFSKLGYHYKAVFKKAVNDKGEEEIYLQSLVKGSKKI
ncbi:phage minor head protein [Helicobacter sp. MIT 21-1697]|uniref:phage head morphogenesis protein n=1 Tax=Helicobacter sp. MIT 21-1697 TaxID=2993733 RepID=UPI00224A70A0|nr:phage minor head protein [Helicobacter sp. MIT 21-1697]MCX2717825.1 phage minor head protein [Helicobacter sp. MIT 21-1697]